MELVLRGKKSIFEDIAEQYRQYIRLGVLRGGDKLPSCRELALELGINPNTVERAYSLLESEQLVVTLPKKGTFVAYKTQKEDLLCEAQKQLASLKEAGLTYIEIKNLLDLTFS